jgi:hypothetical protein
LLVALFAVLLIGISVAALVGQAPSSTEDATISNNAVVADTTTNEDANQEEQSLENTSTSDTSNTNEEQTQTNTEATASAETSSNNAASTNNSSNGSSSSSTSSASSTTSSSKSNSTASKITVSINVSSSAVGNPVSTSKNATLNQGATAYDALCACGLSVNAVQSSYGVYVRGIGGLAEKEHGATSGWMYSVNGTTPSVAASSYKLENGDRVSWYYTC